VFDLPLPFVAAHARKTALHPWRVSALLAMALAGCGSDTSSPQLETDAAAIGEGHDAASDGAASEDAEAEADAASQGADAGSDAEASHANPVCEQPFEVGPCNASIQVYAYEPAMKACRIELYGGCQGNDNRFDTLAACESACVPEGPPDSCPSGSMRNHICISCGVLGGCGEMVTACVPRCEEQADCDEVGDDYSCFQGLCLITWASFCA
jgi:hypothetical protein